MIIETMILAAALAMPAKVPESGPADACPLGYICLTLDQAEQIDLKIIELQRDLAKARLRGNRLGACVGPSIGVGIDGDGDVGAQVGISYTIYGWRLP